MIERDRPTLVLFYCQNVPSSSEEDRQVLEKRYSPQLRLFPVPCSGRLEPLHLLRALEEFADAAYVITCPEGHCRYFEGNARAKKRVERTKHILADIGLEPERVGIVIGSEDNPRGLSALASEILERISHLGVSPVWGKAGGSL